MGNSYFHDRMQELGQRMSEIHSHDAVLIWKGQQTETIQATPARTRFMEQFEQSTAITEIDSKDYILFAADVDFGSGPIEPAIGMQLRDLELDLLLEIVPLNDDQCFRHTTEARDRVRVHTKEIQDGVT